MKVINVKPQVEFSEEELKAMNTIGILIDEICDKGDYISCENDCPFFSLCSMNSFIDGSTDIKTALIDFVNKANYGTKEF